MGDLPRRTLSRPTEHAAGLAAEQAACGALAAEGWAILGRRLRTPSGEIDIVARKDGVVAMIEVKARRTLAEAAHAMTPRQGRRAMAAAAFLLARSPEWGAGDVRFDVIVVDRAGRLRRITDAFRCTGGDGYTGFV